jgi:hypothetical protein
MAASHDERLAMPSPTKLRLHDVPADLPPGTYDAVVTGLVVVHAGKETTYVLNAVFKGPTKEET